VADRIQPRAANHPLPDHPWTWRRGEKLPFSLYVVQPGGTHLDDVFVCTVDSAELAAHMVTVLNAAEQLRCLCPPRLLASGGSWPLCPVHGNRD
jgi:hypothetical protein